MQYRTFNLSSVSEIDKCCTDVSNLAKETVNATQPAVDETETAVSNVANEIASATLTLSINLLHTLLSSVPTTLSVPILGSDDMKKDSVRR